MVGLAVPQLIQGDDPFADIGRAFYHGVGGGVGGALGTSISI